MPPTKSFLASAAQADVTFSAGALSVWSSYVAVNVAGNSESAAFAGVLAPLPAITGFTPTSGPVGTVVTITGTNFTGGLPNTASPNARVTAVAFNGVPATFTVNSATQITATVPAGATTGPISVSTPDGTATSATDFTVFGSEPTITGFTPTSGPVGTVVTITGTNFEDVDYVDFNDTPATFTVNSATQITATVPIGAATGPIRVSTSAGSAMSATNFTVIPRVPPQTIGIFRPNQAFFLQQSNAAGIPDIVVSLGQAGDQPVVGDWDGDGKATVALFRNGQFLIRNENIASAPVTVVTFGQAGDLPVAGDWTGKGFDSIGVFRLGVFFLRNTNTSGNPDIIVNYGLPTDLPVVGDWDGNGSTTVGAFRPSTGFFFLRNENSSGNADLSFFYGLADDLPVAGDWDGDGVTTIGIFRAGTFFLRNTNTAGFADLAVSFGQPGDIPLAGRWKTPPFLPPGDFKTGHSTIVWRNRSTGQNAIWVMDGTNFVRNELLPFAEDCWIIGGTADFNGDGNTDLLWRNQTITGFDAAWLFSGTRPTAAIPVIPEQTDLNWSISCTGDFNRDGRPDIVRRNTATNAVEIWLMDGSTRTGLVSVTIPGLEPTEVIASSGDFDRNGLPELVLHNQTAGTARVVTIIGSTAANSRPLPAPDANWLLGAIGDYNRDGYPDIVWRNPTTGQNVIWLFRDFNLLGTVSLPNVPDRSWQVVGPR
ncbi:MAG: IPT/TIG domain-containing protein [Acidobacteriota bacterium]